MSYLSLANKIRHDELTDTELIKCLSIPNVTVIQHAILKIMERKMQDPYICTKLIEYSGAMDPKFKILGLCRLGHLAIYALNTLGYTNEYRAMYVKMADEDKEQVDLLEKALGFSEKENK